MISKDGKAFNYTDLFCDGFSGLKEEKRSNKKTGQHILGITIMVIFVLLAAQFFATPVAAFTPSPNVMDSTLTSPNAQLNGAFASSVAAGENIVVVGAKGETANGKVDAGHAYTFNAETSVLIGSLTSPNAQIGGEFGSSVAVRGNIMVVGAPSETANGQRAAGHAYAFNAKTGDLISTLTSLNVQSFGLFGSSVASSGNILVVGAPGETAGAGRAYTFNTETGALISTLTSPNAQSDGGFGSSVAASGNIVVVGAHHEGANGQDNIAGHAYRFNAETGVLISTLTSPNAQFGGEFGFSVAAGGSILVVGAPDETANGQVDAGHAYRFNAETGVLIGTLTSPNAQFGGGFGTRVVASGNIMVVGAPDETVNGQDIAGHAYIFRMTLR